MKRCFKCLVEKELSEFYTHPRMADGYLGKCKECTKQHAKNRYLEILADPVLREKELKRQREKEAKARTLGKLRSTPERKSKAKSEWAKRNLSKRRAQGRVAKAIKRGDLTKKPCDVCGDIESEAHHDDYSRPLEVIWLCDRHHKDRHIQLRQLKKHGKLIPF